MQRGIQLREEKRKAYWYRQWCMWYQLLPQLIPPSFLRYPVHGSVFMASCKMQPPLYSLNPDFAVGFVMRVSNAIRERVSGYFLGEEIGNYFEVKKNVLKVATVQRLEAAIEFQLQNLG